MRPERVRVEVPRKTGENRLPGRIERVVYAGAHLPARRHPRQGEHIQCMLANDGVDASFERGAPVSVYLPCEALRVLGAARTDEEDEPLAASARARGKIEAHNSVRPYTFMRPRICRSSRTYGRPSFWRD